MLLGSARYPLVKEASDGRFGYLPTWRHGLGEYLRAALAHGFEARALVPVVPEASAAAYRDTTALVVWDFEPR